ncbi:MAG: RluA family pseudouridine synthase [bacterium]
MNHDLKTTPEEFTVKSFLATEPRLDAYLASRYPDFSRSMIQKIISAGGVLVNGRPGKSSYKVRQGDEFHVSMPELPEHPIVPEDIPLDILYEDQWLTVVNKPAGMVVHPAKGNWRGTLVNALQFRYETLSSVGGEQRPGIIHRLDRDTTGLVLVARDDETHRAIASQFENRTVEKKYLAVVYGEPSRDRDFIERPIGHHPTVREKMTIKPVADGGKESRTFYEVVERYGRYALLRCELHTGRTHKIRVHMHSIGTPIMADKLYAGRERVTLSELRGLTQTGVAVEGEEPLITRQALHAHTLALVHPQTGKRLELQSPIPPDMITLIQKLRELFPPVAAKGRKS